MKRKDKKTANVAAAVGSPRRRRFGMRSLRVRSLLSFLAYSLVLLIVLWSLFFIVLFGFGKPFIETEFRRRCRVASASFPVSLDDRSVEIYKMRLTEFARDDTLAMAVFTVDEQGEYVLRFTIDALGNSRDEKTVLFDAILDAVEFDKLFVPEGDVMSLSTSSGNFVVYGSKHSVRDGDDMDFAYLLIASPNNLLDARSRIIMNVMLVGTVIVVLASFVASLWVSKYQTKRIIGLSKSAKKLADGDYSVVFSGGGCDEYDDLANALNTAKDEIKKTEQMQREMIANVSHDIRTPLTMIRASAEMLRDLPMADDKREKTAGLIIEETDRLNGLVNDVLSLSKLQSGVTEFNFESVDLSQLTGSILERFEIFKSRNGIIFESEIDEDAEAECDKEQIERCLYNLVNNAVNYCGDDKTVIIRVKNEDDGVLFEVSDHGKGIAPEELDKVWDRYYRAAHSRRTSVGTGLGLSICRSILERHGAEYGVRSELGEGTTFWFRLKTRGGGKKIET